MTISTSQREWLCQLLLNPEQNPLKDFDERTEFAWCIYHYDRASGQAEPPWDSDGTLQDLLALLQRLENYNEITGVLLFRILGLRDCPQ